MPNGNEIIQFNLGILDLGPRKPGDKITVELHRPALIQLMSSPSLKEIMRVRGKGRSDRSLSGEFSISADNDYQVIIVDEVGELPIHIKYLKVIPRT